MVNGIGKEIGDLVVESKAYLNKRMALLKLQGIKETAEFGGALVTNIVLFLIAVVFLNFFGIFAGLLIGEYFNSYLIGFGILAGFFLLLFILCWIFRKKILKLPIVKILVNQFLERNPIEVERD